MIFTMPKWATRLLIVIIVLNAVITLWLVRENKDQAQRIRTLERHDKVVQTVDAAKEKATNLKDKVEGWLH